MKNEIEIWKYQGNFKLYIADKPRSKILTKKFKITPSNVYYSNGKEIGWDYIIPVEMINEIKKALK